MSDSDASQLKTLHSGRFLELVDQQGWEYVRRTNSSMTIAILAVTDDDHVLFVEQYRPPVGCRVIELPAGLVGDDAGHEQEQAETAAKRELIEETGYEADELHLLGTFCSSAGLTNELTMLYFGNQCRQIGEGGGVAGESIQIHKIPRKMAADWLSERIESGELIDGKVWTAWTLAERNYL